MSPLAEFLAEVDRASCVLNLWRSFWAEAGSLDSPGTLIQVHTNLMALLEWISNNRHDDNIQRGELAHRRTRIRPGDLGKGQFIDPTCRISLATGPASFHDGAECFRTQEPLSERPKLHLGRLLQ